MHRYHRYGHGQYPQVDNYGADSVNVAPGAHHDSYQGQLVLGMNPKPVARLLAFSAIGGVIGKFAIGGPIAVIGGVLLGGLAEEMWARIGAKRRST